MSDGLCLLVIARDSGFGDDYLFHQACDDFLARAGESQLVPVSSVPPRHRVCFHCRYGLREAPRPNSPKGE